MIRADNFQYLERPASVSSNQKPPLLILLHGYGANEHDLFSFVDYLPEDLYVLSVRAPYAVPMQGFAWYSIDFDTNQNKFYDLDQARSSLALLNAFIDDVLIKLPVDPNNINLLGFSQGAVLSYVIALNTNKIKNVIALSGYLEEELLDATPQKNHHTRFFISHGTIDEVIPFDWGKKAPIYLQNLNIIHTFKQYTVGHGISPQNFEDFKDWILKNIMI